MTNPLYLRAWTGSVQSGSLGSHSTSMACSAALSRALSASSFLVIFSLEAYEAIRSASNSSILVSTCPGRRAVARRTLEGR